MYTVFCGRQVAATATGGQISSSSVIDLEASDDIAEHSTSDSTGADATSRPSSHVEPVSPVIGRYLQKATTAPPTIRHFFKSKQPENDNTARSLESEPERNVAVDGDGSLDKDDDVLMMTSEHEELGNKRNSLQPESGIVRTLDTTATTGIHQTLGASRSSATSNKSSTKRSGSSVLPAAKKPRQSSIQALFSTAARNPQKLPSVMQCPICCQTFDEAVSNADVNKHIDNCLVEY